jgi:predicted metal-dependent enzyme (double-stranded beta helix superfamily)
MEKVTLPTSLSRLVNLIDTTIQEEGKLSPKRAKEVVLQANVQLSDMMEYADFDHPNEDCYGRKLVYDAGNFEVMVMSWNPGDYSSIHNHGYTEWGVVQVFGHTHHFLFNLKDEKLSFAKKEILPAGAAIKVNNALIHQMGNTTTEPYMTLHVYGANTLDGDITADAKNFDLEFDRIALTCGGAFFNLPDEAIHSIVGNVKPTRKVFLHHAHLLMNYYNRQEQTEKIIALKYQLLEKMESVIFEDVNAIAV